VCACASLALALPAFAAATPVLQISSSHIPAAKPVPTGTFAHYALAVANVGSSETTSAVTVDFTVPAGLTVTNVTDEISQASGVPVWSCVIAPGLRSVSCTGPEAEGVLRPISAGEEACEGEVGATCRILITVEADPDATPGTLHPSATACGGGATICPTVAATAPDDPLEVVPYDFHIVNFDGEDLEQDGDPELRAGAHPFTASTEFSINTYIHAHGDELPTDDLKDATVNLPAGLVESPRAVPTCTEQQLSTGSVQCPPESQIGTVTLDVVGFDPGSNTMGLYNMSAPHGVPALFGFNASGSVVNLISELRTGVDYGVTVKALNAPESMPVAGAKFTFWGVPADPGHDADRGDCINDGSTTEACPSAALPKPFFSLPTSCLGPVRTVLAVTGWEGGSGSASFLSHQLDDPLSTIGAEGCNALDFSPTLEARPTTNVADAPSGLEVDIHIPQRENCSPGPPMSCEAAEAHLKDTTVTLPEGLVVNPSGANGLGGCSEAQFGYTTIGEDGTIHTTPGPATCPDKAELGTVEVDTPLLEHPLFGAIYAAEPFDNPFKSLLAVYLSIDDPISGIVVKLAGKIEPDRSTGRLAISIDNSPQLPFEDFKLHFFGGAAAPLRTPPTCATYRTTSALTPWSAPDSGPPASPEDVYGIERSPGGGACPTSAEALPSAPSFDAGTVSPLAGAETPFVFSLRREDGSQQLSAITLTSPPGLAGKLTGIPYCPDSALEAAAAKTGTEEKANPSCPVTSRVGTVDIAAGAGPAPYYVQGNAYLTGPYKGAPLGLVIVTPAVAGPFDLGTVVTRAALYVDPADAQLRVVSDPLPDVISGIPLDLRSLKVVFDRPGLIHNPTSCDPMSLTATATTLEGATVDLSNRFQVGDCARLPFRPSASLALSGGLARNSHPALRAVLRAGADEANLAGAAFTLPAGELLDTHHIRALCARQLSPDSCPPGSRLGYARLWSPLFEGPFEGPIYLRAPSGGLPDLLADLQIGQFHLLLHGHTAAPGGRLGVRFPALPDAPLTKAVFTLAGGRGGIFVNSETLCGRPGRAEASLGAHNGKRIRLRPLLRLRGSC
jgi:hypothetical protein